MKNLFLILIFSINWAIGIQAVDLPSTAQSLALSNTGIALPLNSSINSSYNPNIENLVSFSSNYIRLHSPSEPSPQYCYYHHHYNQVMHIAHLYIQ